jgi:adenosylhomocysteine nucleosidase
MDEEIHFVVIISASAEWVWVKRYFTDILLMKTPFGDAFLHDYRSSADIDSSVLFVHGGWGKVSAAASSQYVIDRWHPSLIINLGTCGGFEGKVKRGEVLLVEKTYIYDIYEQMGNAAEHLQQYEAHLDTSWIKHPYPIPITRSVMLSADRDLFIHEIPMLKSKYAAIAGDWESGAIAWTAEKNQVSCLILRGVTDIVGEAGGEAYDGNRYVFYKNAKQVMENLLNSLPLWIIRFINHENS